MLIHCIHVIYLRKLCHPESPPSICCANPPSPGIRQPHRANSVGINGAGAPPRPISQNSLYYVILLEFVGVCVCVRSWPREKRTQPGDDVCLPNVWLPWQQHFWRARRLIYRFLQNVLQPHPATIKQRHIHPLGAVYYNSVSSLAHSLSDVRLSACQLFIYVFLRYCHCLMSFFFPEDSKPPRPHSRRVGGRCHLL